MNQMITLQMTQQEANALLGALDTAIRSQGYAIAEFAVSMGYKIRHAIQAAQPAQAPAQNP